MIEPLGRGLFERADAVGDADPDLLEIAHRAPRATLCLITALARHGLTDAIPASIDIALPRGQRHPRTQAPVTWHSFAPDTFDIGRGDLTLTASMAIGLYNPERCIIDAFRLRHIEGTETAVEALRRWLRQPGTQPTTLLAMARAFPKAGAGAALNAGDPAVTASRRPTRATVEGRAYLDLQNLARRQQRPTDELHQLYALEGFLARLARFPARRPAGAQGRRAARRLRRAPPDPRRRHPGPSDRREPRSTSYSSSATSQPGPSTTDSSSTPTPPRQTSSATMTSTAASASR